MDKPEEKILLTPEEETTLRGWVKVRGLSQQAYVILLASEARTPEQIAEIASVKPDQIRKWKARFLRKRLNGLRKPRRSGLLKLVDGLDDSGLGDEVITTAALKIVGGVVKSIGDD